MNHSQFQAPSSHCWKAVRELGRKVSSDAQLVNLSRCWSFQWRQMAGLPVAAMIGLFTWLIVSAAATASDARHSDAVGVFHCTFLEDWDANYDRWPDRWQRKNNLEFPHYVKMEIVDDATAAKGRCLRIDLDGASAAVYSPPVIVMSRFTYVLEARLKVTGLDHGQAFVRLDFYNKAGKLIATERSDPIRYTDGWLPLQLTAEPSDPAVDRAVIGLEVLRGNRADLHARVSLDDVWMARLPRIRVSTNNPFNVYSDRHDVRIKCELSGIAERDPEIRFQLLDATQTKLQDATFRLDGQLIVEDSQHKLGGGAGLTPASYEGSAEWQPTIPDYGLYCVVVKMLSAASSEGQNEDERELDSRTVWIAVVPPLEMPRQGDFGWSLPDGAKPLGFQQIGRLLPQAAVSWVKVPLWFDTEDAQLGNELIRFVELLGASNIEVVGVLDRPPENVAIDGLPLRADGCPQAADLFALDPSFWAPSLDPIMTRMALRVRWWQLGRDHDTSFMGFPRLDERLRELRTRLFRFGQEVKLGLAWDWEASNPVSGHVTWDFEQLSTESPPSNEKFAELLARPRTNNAVRWVLVEPPRAAKLAEASTVAALEARAAEFVHRLVAAKEADYDGIFIANPFNDENGLMREDGTPGELLLPWRTTSALLGGSRYLGKVPLPKKSENRIFMRPDGQVIMVLWNDKPVEEALYLGHGIQHFDVWGRTIAHTTGENGQVVKVGLVPSFILGLHEAVTRWRMAMSFGKDQVPSVFSIPHANTLRFQNFFPQGVGGTYSIVVPEGERERPAGALADEIPGALGFVGDRWRIDPPRGTFRLAAGESLEIPFDIRLKNAMFGKQPVRVDFEVHAEDTYKFTVFREMEVGTSDLTLEVRSHLEKDGTLIVEQFMSNRAERLADFKCNLYAKGERRQRMQVFRLGSSIDRKVYRYPNGRDLLGNEMLLEIEELNGLRVIKYRFEAQDQPNEDEKQSSDDAAEGGERVEREPAVDEAWGRVTPLTTLNDSSRVDNGQ